ncbi:MAG: lysostaphin resistance A-like protein [Phycisphaerae bacterium]
MPESPLQEAGAPASRTIRLAEAICLACVITAAFAILPQWLLQIVRRHALARGILGDQPWMSWAFAGFQLAIGLVLALSAPIRSGVRIGTLRPHWWKVLALCVLSFVPVAVVYPLLPVHPFAAQHFTVWLVCPLAEDLTFIGYLYGLLGAAAPAYVHRRLRIRWALVLTAVFFSLHHFTNYQIWPASYVNLQLAYSFVGLLVIGLTRQWTGSILYATFCHTGINLIAWLVP